jgi:hypothetical protein
MMLSQKGLLSMFMRLTLAVCILIILSEPMLGICRTEDKRLALTIPACPWMLTLAGDDLIMQQQQIKPDGRSGYFLISDKKNNVIISLFIEPAINCKDSKGCRDMVWKLGNPSWETPQNVNLSEIGDVSFFEFLMPSFRGQSLQQQNMYAEFGVDGFWVDLHISKILYKPQEHQIFERIVTSIKFEAKKK